MLLILSQMVTNSNAQPVEVERHCPQYSSELIEISDDSDTESDNGAATSVRNRMDYSSFCLQVSSMIPRCGKKYIHRLKRKADTSPDAFFMKGDDGAALYCRDVQSILEGRYIAGACITIWFALLHKSYPAIHVTEPSFAEFDIVSCLARKCTSAKIYTDETKYTSKTS